MIWRRNGGDFGRPVTFKAASFLLGAEVGLRSDH